MRPRILITLAAALLLAPSLRFNAWASGGDLYQANCASCHGPDAKGLPSLGKDLIASTLVSKGSDGALLKFIKDGRAADDPANTTGVPMPPSGGNTALTDQNLKEIVGYLRSLKK